MVVTLNHEMNQPLSVICLCTDNLIENIEEGSEMYDEIKMIHKAAWKLVKLVKKTTELKKIKTVDYTPGTKMINLHEDGENKGK